MNERQRLYLVQARSDWQVFLLLRDQPVCHRLHYLQMCTEKLGKAYFWRGPGAENLGHAAFVKFVRAIAMDRKLAGELGFGSHSAFREWIDYVSDLAHSLERLAPALAGDGPNPEYPWPRSDPRTAPVEHRFQVWTDFQTRNGHHLRRMLRLVLERFEAWY
jgi:hypothetical protein